MTKRGIICSLILSVIAVIILSFNASATAQCNDGIDNDGDGKIDFQQTIYEYTFTHKGSSSNDINCSTSIPSTGYSIFSRQCYQYSSAGTKCFLDLCTWRRSSTNKYELNMTGLETNNADCSTSTLAEYSLNSRVCLRGSSSCIADACYFNKSSGSAYEYISLVSSAPADSSYLLKNQKCIYTKNGKCEMSVSLYEKKVEETDDGCESADDASEETQCSDSIDNDGDGATDYPGDSGCASAEDNTEINEEASCNDEQTILRLSGESNALAGLYNQEGYDTRICYSEIFGEDYEIASEENPHECNEDGSNLLLRLSGENNALAELPYLSSSGYTEEVCYDNLFFRNSTIAEGCSDDAGEKEILRLYSETDSHLAVAGIDVGDGGIIFCVRNAGEIQKAYWGDSNLNKITQSNSGSKVYLVIEGERLNNNEVEYIIERKTGTFLSWSEVSTGNVVSNEDEKFGISFTPTSDVDARYRFRARLNGKGEYFTSDETVIKKSSQQINNPPIACIKTPEDGQIFVVDEEVLFTECCNDSDGDVLSYLWDFGDGQTSTDKSPKHTFASSGQKSIKLTVNDGISSISAKIEVLIINSEFAFSFISSPAHNSLIKSAIVLFNGGSKSYVINVTEHDSTTGKPKTIVCLAGNCPSQTSGTTKITISNTPNLAGFSNVNFSWSLSNGYSTGGINNQSFNYAFSSPGDYKITLLLSLLGRAGVWSSSYSDFRLDFGFPYCKLEKNLTESYWFEDGNKNPSEGDCKRGNGQPTTTCCPSGYYCGEASGGWKCIQGGENDAKECSDYNSQSTCKEDKFNVAIKDAESNLKSIYSSKAECGGVVKDSSGRLIAINNCRCEWSSNSCKVRWNEGTQTGSGLEGTCNIDLKLSEDQCSELERVRIYEQTANWIWEAGSSKSADYPEMKECLLKNGKEIKVECTYFSRVELPFLGFVEFIIAGFLIFGYYLIQIKKKR